MPKKSDLRDEYIKLSGELSIQNRAIVIGLLVFIWGLLFTDIEALQPFVANNSIDLIGIGTLCFIAMLFDFIHYYSGWKHVDHLLRMNDDKKPDFEIQYKDDMWSYKWWNWAFNIKIITTIVAIIWFGKILIFQLL